ncbi:hypothetical protein D3C71_1173060 [compost metagenome]
MSAFILGAQSGDVVRRNPPLLVGRSRKRHSRLLSIHEVNHFNSIADGVDILEIGHHMLIDDNMSSRTEFQSAILKKSGIRCHANGKQNHFTAERLAAGQ